MSTPTAHSITNRNYVAKSVHGPKSSPQVRVSLCSHSSLSAHCWPSTATLLSVFYRCISGGSSHSPEMLQSHYLLAHHLSHDGNPPLETCPQLCHMVPQLRITSINRAPNTSTHVTTCSIHGAQGQNSLPPCCKNRTETVAKQCNNITQCYMLQFTRAPQDCISCNRGMLGNQTQ